MDHVLLFQGPSSSISSILHPPCSVLSPFLQTRKLRHREVKSLALSHESMSERTKKFSWVFLTLNYVLLLRHILCQ